MAKASDLDVAYVSKLARLNLTDEETQLFQKQLADVLKYAEKLREVDVSHVEAAAHAIPIFNVFREDEPRDWFTAQEALSNAPHKANQLFIVSRIADQARFVDGMFNAALFQQPDQPAIQAIVTWARR